MKRGTVILGFCFLLISSYGFSAKRLTGVGIYGNLVGNGSGAFGTSLGLTLKFGNFPVLGAEWLFGEVSHISVSCDYWAVNEHLAGALNYYVGVGGYLGLGIIGKSAAIDFGGRVPLGLQIWALKNLELFGEIAPLVSFYPALGLSFSIRLGFRVHF